MNFQPGDMLFFRGRDLDSRVIEFFTRGPSHVGIICMDASYGPVLHESTTLCEQPDLLTGKRISGVQAHYPEERIRGYHGTVSLCRLTRAWRMTREENERLHEWLMLIASEHYDLRGALLSGTRLLKWTALMPYPDLDSLFCSEMCAAAAMRMGRMPVDNPGLYNPASLLRKLRRCGTYGKPQLIPVSSLDAPCLDQGASDIHPFKDHRFENPETQGV